MPRGISNRNPGNLRWGSPWQGLVPKDARTDTDFCEFIAPAWGIRALAITLVTYQDKHGLHSVAGMILRYAPDSENDTNAYIRAVAQAMQVDPHATIDVHAYATMAALVQAIIRHENGRGPRKSGRWYDRATLNEGLRMAGIVPSPSLKPSASSVTLVSGGAAAVATAVHEAQPVLHTVGNVSRTTASWPHWLRTVAIVLVLGALAAAGYAWWKEHRARKAVQP